MASGVEVARAYITIVPEMRGIQGTIANELGAETIGADAGKKMGSGITSAMTSAFGKIGSAAKTAFVVMGKVAAVGSAAMLTGIGAVTKAAIDGYKQYEQLAGGAQQIFSQMDYGRIAADAQGAYRTMGMSANEYLESINQVGAAFKATMGDEAGYETAKRGMQAISDYASGTGRSVSELNDKYAMITRSTSSYQSIADQFSGILPATSQGFLEQAQAAGLLSGEYTKLTEVPIDEYQQAVTGMLERGVDALGLTGNTAREATQTISGSIDMLKASWSNFVTELGKDDADIEARTQELVDSVIAVAENVIPRAVEIVGKLAQRVPSALMAQAPKLAQYVTQLLDSVTNGAFSKVMGMVQPFAERMGTAVGGLMDRLAPLGSTAGEIAGKFGGILMTALESVTTAFEWLAPIIASIAEAALPLLSTAVGIVGDAFEAALTLIRPVGDFFADVLPPAIETVGEILQAIADKIAEVFGGIKDAAQGAAEFLGDPLGSIGKLFKNTGKTASKSAQDLERNVSKSMVAVSRSATTNAKAATKGVSSCWSDMASKTKTTYSGMESTIATQTASAKDKAVKNAKTLSTDFQSQMESARSTTADKMGKLASSVDTNTANAQTQAAAHAERIKRDMETYMESARATAADKTSKAAASIDTNMSNAQTKATASAKTLSSNLTTQFGTAATTAETKATAIKNAWDKSYTMQVSANADTSSADRSLTTFKNSWNGYNVDGTASNDTTSARDSMSSLRRDWNGYRLDGSTDTNTAKAVKTLQRLIADWWGFNIQGTVTLSTSGGGGSIHAETRAVRATVPTAGRVAPLTSALSGYDVGMGGVVVTGNTFVVRNDSDIAAIGRAINADAERKRKAKL